MFVQSEECCPTRACFVPGRSKWCREHSFTALKAQMKSVTHPVRPQKELEHWFSLELELEEAFPASRL